MLLLVAAAALVGPPGTARDATFANHQATRGRSAVESVEKTCCLQGVAAEHDGLDDDALTLGVQHTAGPPPTPTGTSTPNHVPRTMEDTTSNKITVDKMTSYKTTSALTCDYLQDEVGRCGASGGGPPPTAGTCRGGRSAGTRAKNAKAGTNGTTTTLQHTRVSPMSCPVEQILDHIFEGHAPACARVALVASAVDTTQNAAPAPESVQVIATKSTAGTEAAAATAPVVSLGDLDLVSKRLSALRRLHYASNQNLLNKSVTIQVTINNKIVGQDGSALLPSVKDDDKEAVSLYRISWLHSYGAYDRAYTPRT
jgi:hypothetical protein